MNDWRCDGVRWHDGVPGLGWYGRGGAERVRALRFGEPLAFRAAGARRCAGVWRGGRRTWCPAESVVAAERRVARCPSCAALDRSSSVAADTAMDDPRPFALYLAWFGPGALKLGITAAERGPARLLEQGALAHTWLGEGPLAAVRRAEAALGAATGVPDRVATAAKHAARAAGWRFADARAELAAAHRTATGSAAWPPTVAGRPFAPVDDSPAYRLDPARPPRPRAEVVALADGTGAGGVLDAVVGPYALLSGVAGGFRLDLRLLAGWTLEAAPPDTPLTAPHRRVPWDPPGLF